MPQYTDASNITWNYTESGGNATIGVGSTSSATTLGTSLSGAITIPSTIPYGDGDASYNVTTIRSHAFYQCTSLISVTLPTNPLFTTIGQNAFYKCSGLTSITIPDSVTTIDSGAFMGVGLISVTLPTNPLFTTIGTNAFHSCSSLTSITIPDSVISIGSTAFYQCSSLTSITIPDSVTTIGSHAFNGIGSPSTVTVKNVDSNKTQLEGLEYIGGPGRNHGSDGGLMDGKITGTVTYQPPLTSTPLQPSLSNVSFAYDGTTKYSATIVSNDLEGDNFTFDLSGTDAASFQIDACNNALLESVNPWDLNEPFTYSVTIKATDSTDLSAISLVSIAKTATATDLSTNNISGSTLKTLADQSSVSPNDLYDAGYTVDQLVAAGFSYWNYTLDASNNATIGTGGNWQHPGNATFLGTSLSGAITIPSTIDGYTVIGIGQYAFYNCTGLTSITIPDSVTTIGQHTFRSCSSLTSITIPDSVTTIGSQAFLRCSSLETVDLGNSVTTIGDFAFESCSSLTSITIPDLVTTIGPFAFGAPWAPIGSSVIVYVKDVDPNDSYNKTTLKITISGNISSGNGAVTYEQWVAPNYAPNTPTLSDISCNENTPYTATVSATDDNGDSLTFDLSGADAADFTLSGTDLSGNAVLSAIAVFDFETKETYNITITASDGSLNTSADFIITVNNVVETASVLYNANVQGAILKTTADNDGITTQQLVAAGYTNQQLLDAGYAQSNICFVAGTPVNTDQGAVAIDKLDVSKHTIRGKRIVAVTKTISEEKHLVRIRKDTLAKNVPSQDTLTTQNHTFFYNGNMVEAKQLVNQLDNVDLVKYDGSTLYNVLQDKHEKMVVNNLIAETLHPEHGIAIMTRYFIENNVSSEMQNKFAAKVNNEYKKQNLTK